METKFGIHGLHFRRFIGEATNGNRQKDLSQQDKVEAEWNLDMLFATDRKHSVKPS